MACQGTLWGQSEWGFNFEVKRCLRHVLLTPYNYTITNIQKSQAKILGESQVAHPTVLTYLGAMPHYQIPPAISPKSYHPDSLL